MSVGKRSNVVKSKKGRATIPSHSVLTPHQTTRRFIGLYVHPSTYLAVRRLADNYGLSLCDMVAVLVDAGCVGARIKREG